MEEIITDTPEQLRFDKLNYPFRDLEYCNMYRANIAYFRNVELPKLDNASTLLEQLEDIDAVITKQEQERKEKEERINRGKSIRDLCDRLIAISTGYNIDFGLKLEESYPDIANLIMTYHPYRAKVLIEAIVDDTIEMKNLKAELLEAYNE